MVCSLGPGSVLSEAHGKSFLVSWPEIPSSGNCSKMVSLLVGLILMLYETRLKVVLPV